jgi:hypothetical protein
MPGQPNRRDQARRARNRKKYQELLAVRTEAVKSGLVPHGIDPVRALQTVIDNAVFRYLGEVATNEKLRADGAVLSDRRERSLEKDVAYFATLAMQYNLADRQVNVAEARIALMVRVISEAAAEIGIPREQVKLLPAAMQGALQRMRDEGAGLTTKRKMKLVIPRPYGPVDH